MSRVLRIARVVQALNPGGMEAMMLRALPCFDPARFQFRIVCLAKEGKLGPLFRDAGFSPVTMGIRGRLAPGGLWRLARFFRRERIDIVHSHMYPAGVTARVAALLARTPAIVSQEHNLDTDRRWSQRLIDRLLAGRTDGLLAVSRAVADWHSRREGIARDRYEVIHNGLDSSAFGLPVDRSAVRARLGIAPGAPVIGIVARLAPQKNHDVLLRAAPAILAERPDAVFLFAGDGPCEADLRRLAAELRIAPAVRFLGLRSDVPDILAILDVFAFPSRMEGLPNAILEALAAGLPVVTADGGGPILEVVEHGVSALVVPTGDAGALGASVLEALRPETAGRLRAGARARAADFSVEKTVRRYEEFYERIGRGGSGS